MGVQRTTDKGPDRPLGVVVAHLDVSGDPACGVGLEVSGGLGADTPLLLPTGHRLACGLEPVTCSRCLTLEQAMVLSGGGS
jgi:hypothetical protein